MTLYEARPTLGGAVQTLPRARGRPVAAARQRPAHRARLLHGVPALPRPDRRGRLGAPREPLELPVIDEHGARASIRRRRSRSSRYRHLPLGATGVAIARACARAGAHRRADDETFADAAPRLGPVASGRSTASGTSSSGRRSTCPRRRGGADYGDLHRATALLGAAARATCSCRSEAARRDARRRGGRALERGRRDGAHRRRARRRPRRARRRRRRRRRAAAESARLLGEPDPQLEDSPIVSVHLLFDRRLLRHRLAALLDSPAHWVFDRGALTGHEPPGGGQYLTVVSSGVPELMEALRGRELVELIAGALTERLGPPSCSGRASAANRRRRWRCAQA